MRTNIRTATPPDLIGRPSVPMFEKSAFESLIWEKGMPIIIEHAVACPCRGKSGSAKSSCLNCLGLGYFFINPVETRAIITSINRQTKYQQWSPELTGTVSVSVSDDSRISFQDKVTLKSRTGLLNEVKPLLNVVEDAVTRRFLFMSYNVDKIKAVYIFGTDTTNLIKLSPNDFIINEYNRAAIELNDDLVLPNVYNGVMTVEYEYEVSYIAVDIPHEFRSAFVIDDKGKNVESNMPMQIIAKRTHLAFNKTAGINGINILNNSDE